jgi:drug/metabolite transporter (DMT)-like permease
MPVFMLIISHLWLKESFSLQNTLGVTVAMSGILLLVTGGDWGRLLQVEGQTGNYWMLVATISFAVYSVMLKLKPREISGLSYLYSSFLVGLILLAPFYLGEHFYVKQVPFNWMTFSAFLYVGLFSSILSFFLWNQAVYVLGPSGAAPLYYLVAVFSAIGAWIFLDEPIGFIHLVSMGLIVAGIFISNNRKRVMKTPAVID